MKLSHCCPTSDVKAPHEAVAVARRHQVGAQPLLHPGAVPPVRYQVVQRLHQAARLAAEIAKHLAITWSTLDYHQPIRTCLNSSMSRIHSCTGESLSLANAAM